MNRTRISAVVFDDPSSMSLDETIDSVFAQNHDNIEVILAGTGRAVSVTYQDSALPHRQNIRLMSVADLDFVTARNLAIEAATGEYICTMGAHETLAPAYFEKALDILERDRSIAFVWAWLRLSDDGLRIVKQNRCDAIGLLAEEPLCAAAIVRKSALLEVGGYDSRVPVDGCEDWDLWLSLVERGFTGAIIPEALVYCRLHPGSRLDGQRGESCRMMVEFLLQKHQASSRTGLVELLTVTARTVAEVIRQSGEIERHITTCLEPSLRARKDELEALRATIGRLETDEAEAAKNRAHVDELEGVLAEQARLLEHARRDVAAIRASTSWKVTAPIRQIRRLLRWMGQALPLVAGAFVGRTWL